VAAPKKLKKSFEARIEKLKVALETSATELKEALYTRKVEVLDSQNSIKKLTLSLKKMKALLSDTLSVKLRYEQII
jgi:hypothetical protein